MKNRESLKTVGYIVLICLSFFIATRYCLADYKFLTICWIVIGLRNVYDLVRRIKASKKEDYERISDDNHTDDIHFIKNIFPWIHK
ncbi:MULTISPECIES: hypothetical protein [Pseudobutyrivibrio]|uniref:Uncharacterized protein n=1 Tax=Pseudobutyrivibrio xylanivorans TaxID=185007 RepID=A0A1G5RZI9_PSEXY|nr:MULTISPECIES: hypothetical protein [Pseudobutyrivibrio]MDC7279947.1 hypothetical protein [Butyrivibrio fibrisolvens]SCZ79524.1 hypothetical protein SAMN02910350_01819 [Pseudobutyrivibrio xylanivorans]